MDIVAHLMSLYEDLGTRRYGLEAMSQTSHAIQCAVCAERAQATPALVAAALLHDVGHLLQDDLDDRPKEDHARIGARWLSDWFGPAVTEPVRLHAEAKRYLVATQPGYRAGLSAASERSLHWQGGPMDAAEARAFVEGPWSADAIALRRWDEMAKSPEPPVVRFDEYRALLQALVIRPGPATPG
jgi:phosphonate degradation associated HDIG domain protein